MFSNAEIGEINVKTVIDRHLAYWLRQLEVSGTKIIWS